MKVALQVVEAVHLGLELVAWSVMAEDACVLVDLILQHPRDEFRREVVDIDEGSLPEQIRRGRGEGFGGYLYNSLHPRFLIQVR